MNITWNNLQIHLSNTITTNSQTNLIWIWFLSLCTDPGSSNNASYSASVCLNMLTIIQTEKDQFYRQRKPIIVILM